MAKVEDGNALDVISAGDSLPMIEVDELEPRFRAVTGRGERRGIRLERIYWDGLNRMSDFSGISTGDIVHHTATQMSEAGNLTSLLRVLSFKWALRRLDALEDLSSLTNLNAILQASPSPTVILTADRKIKLFNDAFLTMLRRRQPLIEDVQQLARNLRFSIDTQVEEVLSVLSANRGKTLNTGFKIGLGSQSLSGQINLALAPAHEVPMLIGYISRY
ncbi:ribbon-helix-helix domain-containing protein [Rhizobium sp. HT1-10]|uniref:ribbon-helix-helix domain-containing protein n=1 Tax=Rhizobium sp. HT1-10 TaxID=3111638 RepID=UPI003C184936